MWLVIASCTIYLRMTTLLSVRLPTMWPGFDSGPEPYEFVVGPRPCFEGFFRVLRFPSLYKNQHSQIPIRSGISGIKKRHLVEDST